MVMFRDIFIKLLNNYNTYNNYMFSFGDDKN